MFLAIVSSVFEVSGPVFSHLSLTEARAPASVLIFNLGGGLEDHPEHLVFCGSLE
jgi:hypothetical protein